MKRGILGEPIKERERDFRKVQYFGEKMIVPEWNAKLYFELLGKNRQTSLAPCYVHLYNHHGVCVHCGHYDYTMDNKRTEEKPNGPIRNLIDKLFW